jgi:4-diphosphocytidyl-2-C-methyl-D-erythritol kinase
VTGKRADGYHDLHTLVAFAQTGDTLAISASDANRFTMSGPYASGLDRGSANLVIRARDALATEAGTKAAPVHIHLEKALPLASGMGGGSADAAATLHALNRFWNAQIPQPRLATIAATLGADVPICLAGAPLVARGTGDRIEPLAAFPALPCILVNCGAEVSTSAVFRALSRRDNPPMTPSGAGFGDPEALLGWLAAQRNDLEAAAKALEPRISETLALIADTRPLLARMSGSGATCFGFYDDVADAQIAATALTRARPDWYVKRTMLAGIAG